MIYLFTLLPVILALSFLVKPRFIVTKVLVNTFRIVGALAFALLVLRLYVFDIYKIPSDSMEQSLKVGDKIIIKKEKLPKHNDLVVFKEIVNKYQTTLVKRAIGLPGDTLEIRDELVSCNNIEVIEASSIQRTYYYNNREYSVNIISERLKRTVKSGEDRNKKVLLLTQKEADLINHEFKGINIKRATYSNVAVNYTYPFSKSLGNNRDNFSPFWIPQKDVRIQLDKEHLLWYSRLIKYENDNVEFINDSTVKIGEEVSHSYCFKNNYYFMMGDNRHRSWDSRFWGFTPEDKILGVVFFVLSPSLMPRRVE